MKKIKSHYNKIVQMPKKKFLQLSDDELLSLYQFNKDVDNLLKEYEVVINEDLYVGYLTGIYYTNNNCYFRMECDSKEIYFICNNDVHGGTLISKEKFLQDFRKQCRDLRFDRKREQSTFYIFTVIALCAILLIYFVPKHEDLLIDYSNDKTHNYSSIAELYESRSSGVVLIETYNTGVEEPSGSTASGMMITKDGYLISCAHIYTDTPNAKFNIILADGSIHKAIFVAGDVESDISLLKIVNPDREYDTVTFADSDKVNIGDQCVILGFPGGVSITPVITSGIISHTDVRHSSLTGYLNSYIQTDATANPGNSGGGLFNMKGQVIGIVTSKYTQTNYEGTIYSVSSKTIKQVINDLFYKGYVARPTLGITFTTVTNADRDSGLPYGSQVVEVKDTSNALGLLKTGDIIVAVNGKNLTPAYELYDALLTVTEDKPTVTFEIFDQETKTYRTVSFDAKMRYSSSGYTQE